MAPPANVNVKDEAEKVETRNQPWKEVMEAFEKENGVAVEGEDMVDATRAVGRCEADVAGGAA